MYFADYLPPPKIKYIGKSPVPINPKDVVITNDVDINGLVSPPFSSVVSVMLEFLSVTPGCYCFCAMSFRMGNTLE